MDWLIRLKEMKRKSGLTTKQIAEGSKIPEPTLEKLFSGATKEPKLPTMQQLVHFLGYTLDDLAPKNPSLVVPEVNAKWQKIHSNFEKLNDAGQDRLAEYSDFLITKEEYQKERDPKPVETVRVWQAARSTDNSTPSGWVDMPKEEVEKIFNAPESDADF